MAILYTAERDANENRYEGCVLAKIVDRDYRIMSDIWGTADFALVWDETTSSPKNILINVYDMNPSGWCPVQIQVDATEEIKKAYLDWKINQTYQRLLGTEENRVREIEKGAIAKVVRGRTGKGTVGKVVVQMLANYGMGYRASREYKLAIATSDVMIKKPLASGKIIDVHQDVVWVWQRNCERVDIQSIDKTALLEKAKKMCEVA